jgi:hypothetical protein
MESTGVRVVVAFLHVLGVAVGSYLVLLLAPTDGIAWLPIAALAMALAAGLVSWGPFMYLVVGWSALLAAACAVTLVSLASRDESIGVLLMVFVAGGCFVAGGLLELGVAIRRSPNRSEST